MRLNCCVKTLAFFNYFALQSPCAYYNKEDLKTLTNLFRGSKGQIACFRLQEKQVGNPPGVETVTVFQKVGMFTNLSLSSSSCFQNTINSFLSSESERSFWHQHSSHQSTASNGQDDNTVQLRRLAQPKNRTESIIQRYV